MKSILENPDLKNALSKELRDEFEKLGHQIEGRTGGGDFGEMSNREEDLSPRELEAFRRYGELTRMAEAELQKK